MRNEKNRAEKGLLTVTCDKRIGLQGRYVMTCGSAVKKELQVKKSPSEKDALQ
jgi:hypothetical protein